MTKRPRVGLALSGGIARGPAHLGVLEVLDRAGIPIDCVAGVSAGSLVAALYCAGLSVYDIYARLSDVSWRLLAQPVWPRRGLVSFDKLERWVAGLIGDVQFADLRRPLAIVATDLETLEPVTVCAGPVARAVHASCAVPGLVAPVEIEGRRCGDGGASNNLPVRAARALGAEFVIAVDLFGPGARRPLGPLTVGLAVLENYVRRAGGGQDDADCMIVPDLSRASYVSFSHRSELIAIAMGVRAAEAALPELQAALSS
jgi:NTE family protein